MAPKIEPQLFVINVAINRRVTVRLTSTSIIALIYAVFSIGSIGFVFIFEEYWSYNYEIYLLFGPTSFLLLLNSGAAINIHAHVILYALSTITFALPMLVSRRYRSRKAEYIRNSVLLALWFVLGLAAYASHSYA